MKRSTDGHFNQEGRLALALAAGWVSGWLWATKPEILANVNWLEVMTAFGTVGATIAAVGIAAWQYRDRQRDRRVKGLHYAAQLAFSLIPITVELRSQARKLEKAAESGDFSELPNVLEVLKGIHADASFSRATDLAAINLHAARDIVVAQSRLLGGIAVVERSIFGVEVVRGRDRFQRALGTRAARLKEVASMLDEVQADCMAAIRPSSQEFPRRAGRAVRPS